MTDDIVEQLRDKAFKKCGPTMEAVHTRLIEWKAATALEAQARRIKELEAERDKANQATKDWLSATADEKLENKRLIERVSGLIQEGLMLVGKVEQRDARIAELTGNREAWKGIQEGTARLLQEKEARIAELEAALREAYEVYAGSDGFIPETAAEGYQQQLIKQMVDIVGAALEKKNTDLRAARAAYLGEKK